MTYHFILVKYFEGLLLDAQKNNSYNKKISSGGGKRKRGEGEEGEEDIGRGGGGGGSGGGGCSGAGESQGQAKSFLDLPKDILLLGSSSKYPSSFFSFFTPQDLSAIKLVNSEGNDLVQEFRGDRELLQRYCSFFDQPLDDFRRERETTYSHDFTGKDLRIFATYRDFLTHKHQHEIVSINFLRYLIQYGLVKGKRFPGYIVKDGKVSENPDFHPLSSLSKDFIDDGQGRNLLLKVPDIFSMHRYNKFGNIRRALGEENYIGRDELLFENYYVLDEGVYRYNPVMALQEAIHKLRYLLRNPQLCPERIPLTPIPYSNDFVLFPSTRLELRSYMRRIYTEEVKPGEALIAELQERYRNSGFLTEAVAKSNSERIKELKENPLVLRAQGATRIINSVKYFLERGASLASLQSFKAREAREAREAEASSAGAGGAGATGGTE